VISRGNCTFREKINLAISAGAVGIIIYNQGDSVDREGLFNGDVGGLVSVPTFFVSYLLGTTLTEVSDLKLHMYYHGQETNVTTSNVIVDTPFGEATSVIVVGSHLDSRPEGPGINDDGSGSAANLEFAIQLHKLGLKTFSKIRFCWWGAEEIGLKGSTFYVNNLNSAALANIVVNLNFDMIASPNFLRAVYNGSNAQDGAIRKASQRVTDLFTAEFDKNNLAWNLTSFDGRSDYGPFIAHGIPAGGLFTGAEAIKTVGGRTKYGGLANAAYDPCYHQACDTVGNINQEVYKQLAVSGATVLQNLALQQNLRNYLNS